MKLPVSFEVMEYLVRYYQEYELVKTELLELEKKKKGLSASLANKHTELEFKMRFLSGEQRMETIKEMVRQHLRMNHPDLRERELSNF